MSIQIFPDSIEQIMYLDPEANTAMLASIASIPDPRVHEYRVIEGRGYLAVEKMNGEAFHSFIAYVFLSGLFDAPESARYIELSQGIPLFLSASRRSRVRRFGSVVRAANIVLTLLSYSALACPPGFIMRLSPLLRSKFFLFFRLFSNILLLLNMENCKLLHRERLFLK